MNQEDVYNTSEYAAWRCHPVINNFTFDGATKDPLQRAVRKAPIGFKAATPEAQVRSKGCLCDRKVCLLCNTISKSDWRTAR